MSFNKPPIIILTPGKVGSSSIYFTLKKRVSNKVFHIHNISQQGIQDSVKTHLDSDRKSRPLHLIISELLRKKMFYYKGKVLIITVIREPISREVSSFFQNTEFYKDILENKKLQVDVEKSLEILYQKLDSDICNKLEDWFDLEIKSNFSIDVFSKPFDYEKKYMVFQNKKTSLLLLKMEDLDTLFPKVIKEFLNLDSPINLQNANVADNKHYSMAYKKVSQSLKLDLDLIQDIINSRFFKHFYINDKDSVQQKWKNKV